MIEPDFTLDTIWSERIRIFQPKRGYRFALDAVLLAHFLKASEKDDVLEIGTGSGVAAILFSHLKKFRKLVALEIQPSLAAFARKNFEVNALRNVELVVADLKDFQSERASSRFDLIFSNPPYRKLGTGKLNPSREKAVARHEISLKLQNVFDASEQLLKPDGRLTMILPAFREKDFHACRKNLFIHEWQYVHSFHHQPPVFFLATAGRQQKISQTHPAVVIYESPGKYTTQLERMLRSPAD